MDFYTTLLLPEGCPAEDCKTEFDGRRVESVDVSGKTEYLLNSKSTSLFHHIVGKLFEDVIVPVLVRFREVTPSDGLAEPEVVSLVAVSLDRNDQVSQAFSPGELAEHKNEQLIPTGEALYIAVSQILRDDAIELAAV